MSLFDKYWLDSLVNILYSFAYTSEGVTEKLINTIKLNLEHMPSQDLCKIATKFAEENSIDSVKTRDDLLKWINDLHNLFNQHLRLRHTVLSMKVLELNKNNPKFLQPGAAARGRLRSAAPVSTGNTNHRFAGISIHRKTPPKKISTSLDGVENAPVIEQAPHEPVRVAKKGANHPRMGIRRSVKPIVIYHVEKAPVEQKVHLVEDASTTTIL